MNKQRNTAASLFTVTSTVQNIDTASIERAKEMFETFEKSGVIFSGTFESNIWGCTDQYQRLFIRFNVDKLLYKRFYESMLGIDYHTFTDYLKTYIMFCMENGTYALQSLNNIVRDVKHLIKTDFRELCAANETISLKHPNQLIEFFTMLPEAEDEEDFGYLSDFLENVLDVVRDSASDDATRDLAAFDSYFLFNDILNDYWKSDIDLDTRIFFYPIYLWWKISGVIPLRPREFLLTPRNCLREKEDGYYLTLRRNHIKGTGRKKNYKIPDDYYTVEYKIPDNLAQDIQKYLDYTKEYDATDLVTLFITDPHYMHWNHKKRYDSRFFTYANMCCVLRYFYNDVIVGKYHLTIQRDRTQEYLKKGEIHYIYLGDTRHLALINIIAEGGTPVLAMMLAGHDSIETAAHYYANITALIKCRTYNQYRKVLRGEVRYEISLAEKFPPERRNIVLRDGNKCYSDCYRQGDFSDCKKTIGPKGEIGYCPDCIYYRKSEDANYLSDETVYKRRIEDDCKYLEKVIHSARSINGDKEDILKAFLKLNSSSYDYEEFLKEKERNRQWEDH